ncbi:hypothetical protein C8J57DRAFT_1435895 [Mycena rebaudengoi]|nr:hypothetical protein C8J57DRAFT_1435895 [Mycena rebaudengoi]
MADDWGSSITTTEHCRRYATAGGTILFVGERLFRSAWFLYTQLQDLRGDMTCPDCGPYPEDTIWDGVTLAFNRKQLLASLCPPTTVVNEAPSHRSTYIRQQCLLVDQEVCRAVKRVVTGDGEGADHCKKKKKVASELIEIMESIPTIVEWLKTVDKGLSGLFERHFGMGAIAGRVRPEKCYVELLRQVVAEESVLQMVPVPALAQLFLFCEDPTNKNKAELLAVPAIYTVLKYEHQKLGFYSEELMGTCRWICDRGIEVMSRLMPQQTQLENPRDRQGLMSWLQSGCYYSMPQIRLRPQYPKLTHDQIHEGSKRGATCSKFYAQYGQQRLTGGIMCVWCTHSICYGFHCIPLGEGRNDVFSAIVTRWPKAPKRVIYDFACALGPYCLTREPNFFADTQFLIDDFHSSGHSKCSPAAFLKTYVAVDACLGRLNSSAAECGNGGIARIQKSVSYMTQARAIAFTQVFIAIWNRIRIRKHREIK